MNRRIEKKIIKVILDGKLEKLVLARSINGNGWEVKAYTSKDGFSYIPLNVATRYFRRKYCKQKVEFKFL